MATLNISIRYVGPNPTINSVETRRKVDDSFIEYSFAPLLFSAIEVIVGVHSSASPIVTRWVDFDPLHGHKYTLAIITTKRYSNMDYEHTIAYSYSQNCADRVLDVVAISSEDYKIRIKGLQLILDNSGGLNFEQTSYYA